MASRLDVDGHCEAPVKETDALEMGRRNASTWACRLPPEIWIIIADLMTVKGIEALNFTCYALHVALTGSLTLWRSVVSDLLVIAPNIILSHSLASATARDLRMKALKFCEIDRVLETTTGHSRSWRRLRLPEPSTRYGFVMVPGTSYAVYISMLLSIRLFSCTSGKDVDACNHPADLDVQQGINHGELFIYPSATYGNAVITLVNFTDRHGQDRSVVWLLQVQISPVAKLRHLSVLEVDEFPEYITLADSTLALLWSRGRGHSSVRRFDVAGPEGKAMPLDDVPWSIPYSVIDHMDLLTQDTLVFVTDNNVVVLAHLSPHQPFSSAQYRTLTAASLSEISFYTRYKECGAATDLCIDIFQGLEGYTLYARDDYISAPAASPGLQLRQGTRWIRALRTQARTNTSQELALAHVGVRRIVSHDEVAWRLGHDVVQKEAILESMLPEVHVDEWIGMCVRQEFVNWRCEDVIVMTV